MKERIFNLFLYVTDNVIQEIGATVYEREGHDREKLSFLQSRVDEDHKTARRFQLPDWCFMNAGGGRYVRRRISYPSFLILQSVGQHMRILDGVFAALDGPREPLMVITPVVDGKPKIEAIVNL